MKSVPLTSICKPKQWKTISTKELKEDGYPVYGANGKIGFYNKYTHEFPTVLITCRGATCGSINISEPKSYVNGNAMALDNLSADVHLYYLAHYLRFRKLDDVISGSAQPQITGQGLSSLQIPLPPLEQQKKIAAILDAADAYRQKTKALIAKYDELTQSLFLDMFGDPVKNEKGWEKVKIRDLILDAKYGTSSKAIENGKYPYIRMNNITYNGYMDYSNLKFINIPESDKDKYLVRKGDVIFNRTNSKELVGKTGIISDNEEKIIAGYLIRMRTNLLANPYYIWRHLNSAWAKSRLQNMCKSIVGMANINAQELQNIEILKAPVALQNQFAERVQAIEEQKSQAQASLEKAEDLFNSLLQRAFKGELV